MGEEMGETEGKGGRGERRAVTRNSFHFPVDPSFFFYSPLQIQDHLKSTHGHVHPPPYTKSPHLFESYDIHAGYIYIYVYVRLSRGREWGWKKSLDTLRPSNDVPAVLHPLDNTANPRRRWSSFHPGFPPRGSRNHLQPLIFIRATPASFITSFSSSNRLLDT